MPALILENARIYTLGPTRPTAEAIAVSAGRIVAVGSRDEVASAVHGRPQTIDLEGKVVVPAFIDAHTHFQKAALARLFSIDFLELRPRRIEDVLTMVSAAVGGRSEGSWVRGDALDPRRLEENRYPTRWELDTVAPKHPVVLLGVGNHAIAANSLALSLAGIDRTTDDPPGGRLDRTVEGDVTGVLRELGKLRLDPNRPDSVLPSATDDDRAAALEAAFDHLHASGVTTIHDVVMDPNEIRAYVRLHREGRLRIRVRLLVRGYEARTSLEHVLGLGIEAGFGDEWLQFSGIKLSIDGACSERNAAVFDPYPGEPENTGLVRIPQETLNGLVDRCHAAGVRLAIHAIGQRAVDMALDAYEAAFARTGRGKLRHRIEHAYLPPAGDQVRRIASANLVVSTQPSFFWDGDGWVGIWGPGQLDDVMPIRSMLDHGITVVGGTDYPCVPVAPLPGLGSLVTRVTQDGDLLGPGQAISALEALRLQTTSAAFAGYDEALLGSLAPGKAADMVVLSDDPLRVAPEEIGEIRSEMTLLGGSVVYARTT